MNVLQFYRTYFPETQGGLEEAIRQICLSTTKLGASNRVLTLARVRTRTVLRLREAEVIQVPLQAEPASCSMGIQAFSEFREQAKWADVIHIHYPWPFADLVHLVSRVRKPVVVTYHSDIIRQRGLDRLYSPLRRKFFRTVDEVIATSPNYVESSPFLKTLSTIPKVIPLALDSSGYPEPTKMATNSVISEYGCDFYLFVGVLRYYKGLHDLVAAAAINRLPVVIAGTGPEELRLKAQAAEMGAGNVRFAGYVSDDIKQALYKQARAVVFPSCERSEAFGVTLLEGQLHAKPLITCELGTGTSYVNRHSETGLVVPPKAPEALSEAMLCFEQNPREAEEMGLRGYERYKTLFSSELLGRAHMEIYERLSSSWKDKKSL